MIIIYVAYLSFRNAYHTKGHKKYTGMTPATCRIFSEGAKVVLVWVWDLGYCKRIPSMETTGHISEVMGLEEAHDTQTVM